MAKTQKQVQARQSLVRRILEDHGAYPRCPKRCPVCHESCLAAMRSWTTKKGAPFHGLVEVEFAHDQRLNGYRRKPCIAHAKELES